MADRFLGFYDKKFFEEHEPWRKEYTKVSKWIKDNIDGKTFGDVGCGNGFMISDLSQWGKTVWGVDGSDNFMKFVEKSVINYVSKVDLTEPLKLKKCDVVLCFEVAEHIEKKFDDIFVDNIIGTKAKTILFTAAHPGQGGTNHVNLQPRGYWVKKFKKRGYIIDPILTEKFKADLGKKVEVVRWYIDNIMIFRLDTEKKLTSIYDKADELLNMLNNRVNSLEKKVAKLEDNLANEHNELMAIYNSKRWKLSSKIAEAIRRK